jgi:hypothetical protein
MSAAPTPGEHVRLLPLDSIRPAPENEKVYRPINGDDPEFIRLADSIAKIGVREPIVVTLDGYTTIHG